MQQYNTIQYNTIKHSKRYSGWNAKFKYLKIICLFVKYSLLAAM